MVRIRKIQKQDVAVVCALVQKTYQAQNMDDSSQKGNEYFLDFFNYSIHEEKLKKWFLDRPFSFVVEVDGRIVGVITGDPKRIFTFFVVPSQQGKGMGKQLFARYERAARAYGLVHIKVMSTLRSVSFYTKFGFKKTTGVRQRKGLVYQPMKKLLT